jgi:putative ABC transport system permease protein
LQAPRLDEIGVDYRVFAFTLFLSLGSGIFFGLVPALQATKLDLNESLNEGGRAGGASYRAGRARNLLLVGEVALSLMLLVGAGLLIKSFRHLREVHPGFNPANVLTLSVTLPYARYPEKAQHAAFFENLIAQVRTLPGVQSAAAVLSLPLDGSDYSVGRSFILEGRPLTAEESSNASYMAATPDYFRTMHIPVLAGRDFNMQDRSNSPKVVVINQSLAQRVFGSPAKAIGKRLTVWRDEDFAREIVGVVADSKGSTLDEPNQPQLFVPYAQDASWNTLSLAVRCASDPRNMASAVRAHVLALDKGLPIYRVQTMDDVLRKSTATNRACMLLFSVFASAALLLAAVGIYGVMAYAVTQRTHEIGIRMALGAQAGDVLRLVVRQGMVVTMGGVGLGLVGALTVSRTISGLLYGVNTIDPSTYFEILILLVCVAFVACYVPARRAAKLNPVTALAQR